MSRAATLATVLDRVPPGYVVITDERVARALLRAALDNERVLPGVRAQYTAAFAEFLEWRSPETGVIRLAQTVLAERARIPLMAARRFMQFARDQELLYRVAHQRFSPSGEIPGVAAGYVVIAPAA